MLIIAFLLSFMNGCGYKKAPYYPSKKELNKEIDEI